MDRTYSLLLVCFVLSGLAALVYQTAWTREFAFVFGTSDLAVATVLAAYMGGLALGAALAGRLSPRIRRPVLAYGLLELGIALCALAVPFGVQASRWLYVAVFGGSEALRDAGGLATALFYLACSFLILLVPTAMMGATLPLLARHAVREVGQIGRRVGILYAANTFGAVAGVLLGAFVLLPQLGLRATIASAAAINALVFLAAWALARTAAPLEASGAQAQAQSAGPSPGRWILPLILISGFVSFSYEVLWVRLIGQIVGASVTAFATMLSSFLLGIALGSTFAARLASTAQRAAAGFAVSQLGIALLSAVAFAAVNRLPGLSSALRDQGLSPYWADIAVSMASLFPAALCIGATFPFAVRVLARSTEDAGPASARTYSWNTVGSIAGSIAAAFLLIPWLGFEGTLILCVGLNLALAAAAAWVFEPRRVPLLVAACAGALVLVLVPPATPWGVLRASSMGPPVWGVYTYLGIGRSSTVLVVNQRRSYALRTNGLPEAGMVRAGYPHILSASTRWLTLLPVFARPEAREMLVIGFGGGMLLEVVPDSVERIDVVELEPEVIEANRLIAEDRWRDPLADPRVNIHVNDARNALLLADRRFDAIVSQPSHPWAGGAAHLYTQEHFELVRDRLTDDGVFVQWIGLQFVDEELFRSLLAALAASFEHVQAYLPPPGGSVLFLASNAPFQPFENAARTIERHPEDMKLLGVAAPEDVLASLILDDAAVRALAEGAPPNRDGHNRLQNRSGRLGRQWLSHRQLNALIGSHDPLLRVDREGVDPFYLLRQVNPPARVARIAESFEGTDRLVGEALAAAAQGKGESARKKLKEVLESEPTHAEARAVLLRLSTREVARGEDVVPEPLSPTEAALVAGWRASAEDPSGAALLELDEDLAAVSALHPLGRDAARLRVVGRLRSEDAERAREAVEIVEAAIGDEPDPASLLLRAEAFSAAGEHGAMLETLLTLSHTTSSDPTVARSALVRRAYRLLSDTTVDDPQLAILRNQLMRRLGPRRA